MAPDAIFSPQRLTIEIDVFIVKPGLWRRMPPRDGGLRQLLVLNNPHHDAELERFGDSFVRFLHRERKLGGPTFNPAFIAMALVLIGAAPEMRDRPLNFRQQEVGKIKWQGKTVGLEAVRRRNGRRYQIIQQIADELSSAETTIRTRRIFV
jgi:hypothetical protein